MWNLLHGFTFGLSMPMIIRLPSIVEQFHEEDYEFRALCFKSLLQIFFDFIQ